MLKKTILAGAAILALAPFTMLAHADVNVQPIELTGSLDLNLDDLGEDNIDQQIKLRDVMARMDVEAASWLAGRIQASCEGTLDVSQGTTCDLKNATIGLRHTLAGQEFVVSVGKQTMPFGANVTRRAIDRHDSVYDLNKQNERRMGVVVSMAPNVSSDNKMAKALNELFALVEVGAYNKDASRVQTDFGQLDSLDSYSTRVMGAIGNVLTEISYLDQKDGEKRMGAAASTALLKTGFDVYGEFIDVKNSTYDAGLTSVATVGIARDIKGFSTAAEYNKNNSKNDVVKDRVSLSAKKAIGKYVLVGAEVSADQDLDDVRGFITATANMNTNQRAIDTRSMFPSIQARVDAQNKRIAELSKAKK